MIVAPTWNELIDLIEVAGGGVLAFEYFTVDGMYVAIRKWSPEGLW